MDLCWMEHVKIFSFISLKKSRILPLPYLWFFFFRENMLVFGPSRWTSGGPSINVNPIETIIAQNSFYARKLRTIRQEMNGGAVHADERFAYIRGRSMTVNPRRFAERLV